MFIADHYRGPLVRPAVNTVALFFPDQGQRRRCWITASAQFATEDGLVFTAARAICDESMAVLIAPSVSPRRCDCYHFWSPSSAY